MTAAFFLHSSISSSVNEISTSSKFFSSVENFSRAEIFSAIFLRLKSLPKIILVTISLLKCSLIFFISSLFKLSISFDFLSIFAKYIVRNKGNDFYLISLVENSIDRISGQNLFDAIMESRLRLENIDHNLIEFREFDDWQEGMNWLMG